MADFNSSLPIKTESNGDVAIKVVDGTITSRQLTINSDGSVNITDNAGSLTVDGTVELGATTLAALESITVQNPAGASAVNIQDGGNSITVDATHTVSSIKIGDGTDLLAVNTDGSINVVLQEDTGLEVVNYSTSAALAAGATNNHDWTSAAASKLHQVNASASGKLKIEIQVETGSATGVFNTVAVGYNSTATPNIDITLAKYAAVPNGARVRVIRTNKDNPAQDVHSTIVAIQG